MALYDWGREAESSSCTFPEKGDTIWGEKSYTVRFRTVTSAWRQGKSVIQAKNL